MATPAILIHFGSIIYVLTVKLFRDVCLRGTLIGICTQFVAVRARIRIRGDTSGWTRAELFRSLPPRPDDDEDKQQYDCDTCQALPMHFILA